MKFWCVIHGYQDKLQLVRQAPAGSTDVCSFCVEAQSAAIRHQRDLEIWAPRPGTCGMCGGPSPCMRND